MESRTSKLVQTDHGPSHYTPLHPSDEMSSPMLRGSNWSRQVWTGPSVGMYPGIKPFYMNDFGPSTPISKSYGPVHIYGLCEIPHTQELVFYNSSGSFNILNYETMQSKVITYSSPYFKLMVPMFDKNQVFCCGSSSSTWYVYDIEARTLTPKPFEDFEYWEPDNIAEIFPLSDGNWFIHTSTSARIFDPKSWKTVFLWRDWYYYRAAHLLNDNVVFGRYNGTAGTTAPIMVMNTKTFEITTLISRSPALYYFNIIMLLRDGRVFLLGPSTALVTATAMILDVNHDTFETFLTPFTSAYEIVGITTNNHIIYGYNGRLFQFNLESRTSMLWINDYVGSVRPIYILKNGNCLVSSGSINTYLVDFGLGTQPNCLFSSRFCTSASFVNGV